MSSIEVGLKTARIGYTKIWYQSMKTLTVELNHIGRYRLLDCRIRDYRNRLLGTLDDMAQNCSR